MSLPLHPPKPSSKRAHIPRLPCLNSLVWRKPLQHLSRQVSNALSTRKAVMYIPVGRSKVQRIALHPIQFQEMAARFLYMNTLFNRSPKYVTIEQDDSLRVIQMPLGGFSLRPLYEDWDMEVYSQILARFVGSPADLVYDPVRGVRTWLFDDAEEACEMPLSERERCTLYEVSDGNMIREPSHYKSESYSHLCGS